MAGISMSHQEGPTHKWLQPLDVQYPQQENSDEPENTNRENGGNRTKKHPVGLPYTKGLSEVTNPMPSQHTTTRAAY